MAPARVPASTPPARLASRPRSRGTPRRDDALVAPAPSDVPRRSVARGPRAARLAAANGFREKSRLTIRRDSRWTFLAPRTKRDSARREEKQSVSRRSFSVSREEQKSLLQTCIERPTPTRSRLTTHHRFPSSLPSRRGSPRPPREGRPPRRARSRGHPRSKMMLNSDSLSVLNDYSS